MGAEAKLLTGDKAAIHAFLDGFDTFLFDCDGVLWSGDHLFSGTVETLEMLKSMGKQIFFVTNNSTKSRAEYSKKLQGMGIPAEVDEIFSSSYSSALYISRLLHLPPSRPKIFILGESGIASELSLLSIPYTLASSLQPPSSTSTSSPTDPMPSSAFNSIASGSALDPSIGAVLCGLNLHINYYSLALAAHYLLPPHNAHFLATNTDMTFPSAGSIFPGAGATIAPLVAMLGGKRQPISTGKPSKDMMRVVGEKMGFGGEEETEEGRKKRERTCMVGDRLDTDIKFGRDGGLGGTMLVMTGVTKGKEEWEGEGEEGERVRPRFWAEKLGDLLLVKEEKGVMEE